MIRWKIDWKFNAYSGARYIYVKFVNEVNEKGID